MSIHGKNEPYWMISTNGFTLIYNTTYSMNPSYEDGTVWEYGIECSLYDCDDILVSSAHVSHISPDHDYVLSMIQLLTCEQVFPVHLLDIVGDLLGTMTESKVIQKSEEYAYA